MSDDGSKAPSGFEIQRVLSIWQMVQQRLFADEELAEDESQLSKLLGKADQPPKEIVGRLLRAAGYAKAMQDACKKDRDTIQPRENRWKARVERLRGTAASVMELMGETKLEFHDLTASLAKGKAGLSIDEAKLPAEYWITETVVTKRPDLEKVQEDMEQGVVIDGVSPKNPAPVLQVRKA